MFNFQFDTGTIVTLLAVVFFYIRLVLLSRKNKQEAKQAQARLSKKKAAEAKQQPVTYTQVLGYSIGNWPIGVAGIVILLIGFVIKVTSIVPAPYSDYWYIPAAGGIVLSAFAVK